MTTHYTDHPVTALHVSSTHAEERPPGHLTGPLLRILSMARSSSSTTPTTHSPWTAWTAAPPTTSRPHPVLPLSDLFYTHCLISIWKRSSNGVTNQKLSMTPLCLNDKAQPPNIGCYGFNCVPPQKDMLESSAPTQGWALIQWDTETYRGKRWDRH